MKKAILFDFDYTLADSTEGIVKSTDYALKKLREKEKTKEEIKKTVGISLHDTYKVLTGNNNDERAALFTKYFIQKADEVMVDSTFFYENSISVLENLKNTGFKTGIVTTKLNSRIRTILKKYNIEHLIDVIIGVENVKNVKPDPEGLKLALQKLDLKNKDIIYIGDSFVDAQAAQNAGIDFIGVLTGTTSKEDFSKYNNLCICKDINTAHDFVINNREEI